MQALYVSSRHKVGKQVSAPTPRQPNGSSAGTAALFDRLQVISADDAVRRQHG